MNQPPETPSVASVWAEDLAVAIAVLADRGATSEAANLSELLTHLQTKPANAPTHWKFTHRGESGKLFFTYHDRTPENDYRMAYRDTAVEVTPLYEGPPDEWKDAVTDACTVNGIEWDGLDPRAALTLLLARVTFTGKALAPTVAAIATGDATAFITVPDGNGETVVPPLDSRWTHTNGNVYTVIAHTNLLSDRPEKFPPTVVYRGTNGNVWSRPVSDWYRSFRSVE